MVNRIFKVISIALILLSLNAKAQQFIPLYSDTVPNNAGNLALEDQPGLELFIPEAGKSTGISVIVIPGGAYSFLAYAEEGSAIGKAFSEKGIIAFVLKYRLPNKETMKDKSFGPLMDAQQAIKIVRGNASLWNIDPKKIGVIGYSAGGHLASTLGTHFDKSYIENPDRINLRPDFMILVYPVISMEHKLEHTWSKIALLGVDPPEDKIQLFSNDRQVTKETPPTYLTHTGDDGIVDVNNSIVFYQALQQKGVDAELHLFPKGNHGFTQRLPVGEWMEPMLDFLKREGFYKPIN